MSDFATNITEMLNKIAKTYGTEALAIFDEIERLQEDAIHNEGVMVALREGYTEAKERIEELEDCIGAFSFAACPKHHYTDEQIVAAVKMANKPLWNEAERILIWGTLNKLNIFRCAGCLGEKVISVPGPPGKESTDACPHCNGTGATVGKK